jgi:dCMP deaminase
MNELEIEAISARQEKWDRRYLGLAKYYSQFSKDPSTKVGAVVVDLDNRVAGMGYNGFPEGIADTPERLNNRELKYKLVLHAEVNAILDAGDRARASTLYVWPSFALPPVCNECCKIAIAAGVMEIVGFEGGDDERAARWKDSISISKVLCEEAGIIYRGIKE